MHWLPDLNNTLECGSDCTTFQARDVIAPEQRKSEYRMVAFLFIGIVLLIVAGVAFWNQRTYAERMSLLRRAVPASSADILNAFPGEVVAVSGNAQHDYQLVSEQTQTPCVYYDFEVVRRYERRRGGVSVGNRDLRGRRRHRGTSRGKETVAQNEQWVPFFVRDQAGKVRVNPDGALFEARKVLDRYEREGSNDLFGIPGLDINIGFGGNRTLGYEIRENLIPVDAPVFVAGPVNENGEIARNSHHKLIVSHRPEGALRDEWGKRERRQLIGAAVAAGLGLLSLFAGGVAYILSLF
jgi:hypothetical protein